MNKIVQLFLISAVYSVQQLHAGNLSSVIQAAEQAAAQAAKQVGQKTQPATDCNLVSKQMQDKVNAHAADIKKQVDRINQQIAQETGQAQDKIKQMQENADASIANAKNAFDKQVQDLQKKTVSDAETTINAKLKAVDLQSAIAGAQKDFQAQLKVAMDKQVAQLKQIDDRYADLGKQVDDAAKKIKDPVSSLINQIQQATDLKAAVVQQKMATAQAAVTAAANDARDLTQKLSAAQVELSNQIK